MSDQTPNLRWGHININVSDLERSIAFYRKLGFEVFIPAIPYLGLSLEPEPQRVPDAVAEALGVPRGTAGRACIMQLGEDYPKIDLIQFSGLSPSPPLTNGDVGLARICLGTEDLRSDVARLQSQGVVFLSAPQTGHAKLADIALCRDPDGTLIELIQIYPDRWQSFFQSAQ